MGGGVLADKVNKESIFRNIATFLTTIPTLVAVTYTLVGTILIFTATYSYSLATLYLLIHTCM